MTTADEIQNYGEVFTRRWVVDVLLDLTGYTVDRDLAALRLVEPSCGSGAFLGPAIERLIASAVAHGREVATLGECICAFDLRPEHVETSRNVCRSLLESAGASKEVAARLAGQWVHCDDFLLSGVGLLAHSDVPPADVIVGNPPYIRYDDLPETAAAEYRRTWATMRGRGDVYVGFIERALRTLKPAGRVGFICADRWMRNQYGAALRRLVASRFAVEHVWTMHDVDAFETRVSAYPAIIVLSNTLQRGATVAETTAGFGPASASALAKAATHEGFDEYIDVGVKAHRLAQWFPGDGLWPTGSPARLALIAHLNAKFGPLHDPRTGTRVGIGIATGADKVYVTKDVNAAEADRMVPLSMAQDLATGEFVWHGNYLVNPWAEDGSLVALDGYPRMAAYLSAHPVLRERFVARKAPKSWYRTIDKLSAGLTAKPKLLLQDMKAYIHPVLERGGYYPHHNLYYVVSDTWDMEVLGGLLLGRVAQAYIEAYCVRMRGGTLRFQAQYLRQIRVPYPERIDPSVAEGLRIAFRERDVDAATKAAGEAYDIDLAEYELTTP
ncbi:Eco57I restriction-modification methylase domain-containing protein [Mycobacterium sp. 1245852.3]|uniref:Eco57I restriction-modification methylase domain-containing protein n=1 Tax=Mycobacterium sp. 1245852.3 TaxID=1856860 RepID=UPI0007FFC1AC|nr:Eco57I restriction-modification methylase domain-containing protein [Mycobacterium sp. 1245852.3]OBJ95054.1 DNA methyltransferase [Mycobacterium sp. 1245852.3]